LLHYLTSKLLDSAVMSKYDCDIGAVGGCLHWGYCKEWHVNK